MSDAAIRVLHAPTAVGGQAPGLAAAERALGLASTVVTLHEPPFGYAVDRVLAPPGTNVLHRELRRWMQVVAARSFDVIHFNFGSSLAPSFHGAGGRGGYAYALYARLLEQRDLSLLRRKALFVTYQGDDARPSGDAADDARKQRRVDRFAERVAASYVLNPDLLQYVRGAQFLPYASVDPREWNPAPPAPRETLRLVHAPSDRARKGTAAVVDAVERLRSEGVRVELDLVENRPHAEARDAYSRADVLVDQLVVGWYGAVAVEAMALAKPVIAYLDTRDVARIPADMGAELPIVNATAATIADVIRQLATTRRNELRELGRRGRAYVERWHDPRGIAARVKSDYERALRG